MDPPNILEPVKTPCCMPAESNAGLVTNPYEEVLAKAVPPKPALHGSTGDFK